jgi:RNA polymerase sigma-70 factor (ECF subfamily)
VNSSATEQQLIAEAKRGDVRAFEAILGPVIAAAHRYACALLQDPDLAEDAVQEASMLAWKKLAQLRSGSSFLPWFLGIVGRQCHNQRRGRWWQTIRQAHTEPASFIEHPEDTAVRRAVLREALESLGERERHVVILRAYLELPWHDVATAAGITEAGARTRYYRALGRLRIAPGSAEVVA